MKSPFFLPAAALLASLIAAPAQGARVAAVYAGAAGTGVVRVAAAPGIVTEIEFDPGAAVESWVCGFSSAWAIEARGNRLWLKPSRADADANLAVTAGGVSWLFELRVTDRASANYRVRAWGPGPDLRERREKAAKDETERRLASPLPARGLHAPARNFAWLMNFGGDPASRRLAPSEMFDDGRFTYLRFPPGTDFPAVFRVEPEGESIAPSHAEKDGTLVVRGVWPELRLRAGKAVVGLYAEGRHAAGTSETGTAVPGLVRRVMPPKTN